MLLVDSQHNNNQGIVVSGIYTALLGIRHHKLPWEVETELKTSLEHLYREPSAENFVELPTSTSDDKAFYLAVKSLLEVKGETYVIEQVLKMGGRRWEEGKQRLQQILQQGRQDEWD